MKITIEVTADSREDCYTLLRAASAVVRRSRELSGVTVNACLGDTRILVEEEEADPPVPYAKGVRVRCVDRQSAYFGMGGTVLHSGPRATGVLWDGAFTVNIRPNGHMRPE